MLSAIFRFYRTNENLTDTTLLFCRRSEVESHLFASMRVAPSGVWRRAFVRSCVSLRNRGCSKLSVVPHIVRFRWHRNTMLLSRQNQRVGNYHVISIFICLIYFSLSREIVYIQSFSFLFQFSINQFDINLPLSRYIYCKDIIIAISCSKVFI